MVPFSTSGMELGDDYSDSGGKEDIIYLVQEGVAAKQLEHSTMLFLSL